MLSEWSFSIYRGLTLYESYKGERRGPCLQDSGVGAQRTCVCVCVCVCVCSGKTIYEMFPLEAP